MAVQLLHNSLPSVTFDDLHAEIRSMRPSRKTAEAACWMVGIIARDRHIAPSVVTVEDLLTKDAELLVLSKTHGSASKLLPYCHKLCVSFGNADRFRRHAIGIVHHPVAEEWLDFEQFESHPRCAHSHDVSSWLRYLTSTVEFGRYYPESFPIYLIQRRHLVNFRRHLLVRVKHGLNPNSAKKTLQHVVRFLRWCQDFKGILGGLDFTRITIRKVANREREIPSHAECERLLQFFLKGGYAAYVYFLVQLSTGARPIELIKLPFQDIDETAHSIRLQSKDGAERWMPLAPHVWAVFTTFAAEHRIDPSDNHEQALKNNKGVPWRYFKLRDLVIKARKNGIHIDGLVSLRHLWATDALESGMPWSKVCYYLGHKNPAELTRYQHLRPKKMFEEANRGFSKWEALFDDE